MEAIVKISGKQYRLAKGDRVTVDRLAGKIGDKVTFDQVLLLSDGPKATVGFPMVDGAAVTATLVAATRGPKLRVYKYKAKKRYRRTQGARAEQSLLEVVSISGPGAKAKSSKADTEAPKAETAAPKAEPEAPKAEAEAPKPITEAAEPKATEAAGKAEAKAPKPRATRTAGKAEAAPKAKPTRAVGKAGGDAESKPPGKAKE
jgi:large subunit ribosomal protein L21